MQQMFNKLMVHLRSNKCRLVIVFLTIIILLTACKNPKLPNQSTNTIQVKAIRLKPGQLLKEEIQKIANENNIQAGWISTCVGSLTQSNLRFANMPDATKKTGHFEIVSLTGTVSKNGSHLHMSVSDSTGQTFGGHLLEDNVVYTTAEIVILYDSSIEFMREKDGTTPWEELQIKPVTKKK